MRTVVFFCLILLLVQANAQERYIDSLFQQVKKSTHEYATIQDVHSLKTERLYLDIYEPVNDTETKRAAIIWMHGGGFAGGRRDNQHEVKFMEIVARAGYVGVSISYRLTRKGKSFGCDAPRHEKMETFRKAAEDLWSAIDYVVENRREFRVDTSLLIIGGSSAGAESVLNAVYMKDWLFEGPSSYHNIEPMAIFSLAGAVIDARYIRSHNATPAVLFHGTEDNLVPYATAPHHYCKPEDVGYIWLDGSRTVADRLTEMNSSYLLYTYQGARHEIAGIPFNRLKEVFVFMKALIQGKSNLRKEIVVVKN